MLDKEKKFSLDSARDKAKAVCDLLVDKKASRIVALDVSKLTPTSEVLIIATARSVRHAQALADHVMDFTATRNYELLGMEGYKAGQWILVDMNDLLVNLFLPDVRELFHLEGLWTGAEEFRRLDGESEPDDDPLADYGGDS